MPSKIELCNTSDVDVGGALKVEKDDLILAVFNVDGEFFVTDDACTLCGSSRQKSRAGCNRARGDQPPRSKSKLSEAAVPRQRLNFRCRQPLLACADEVIE